MKKLLNIQVTSLFFCIIISGIGFGQVPRLINYQGLMIDPVSGQSKPDGTYPMTFSIYNVASDGNAIWTETQDVQTKDALFSVLLGSTTALTSAIFSGPEKYLGIKVGSDSEMTPRKRIVSVAYAITSASVSGTSNIFPSEGNVGIGTASPGADLTVNDDLGACFLVLKGVGNEWDYSGLTLEDPTNNKAWSLNHKLEDGHLNHFVIHEYDGTNWFYRFTIIPGGNIGIGLSNPAYKLDVAGDINFTGSLYQNGNPFSGASLWSQNGDSIYYNNGNVGIGTTVPNKPLHVKGSSSGNFDVRIENEGTGTAGLILQSDAGAAQFKCFADGTSLAVWDINERAQRMTINSAGNVGIGTNNPDAKLDVNGDLVVKGAYRGDIGPNNGAPFPRPAWDSGWFSTEGQVHEVFYHNLGGNPDNYVVDMDFKNAYGIHKDPFGGWFASENRMEHIRWFRLTTTSIEVELPDVHSHYADYIRIRIWIYQ